MEGLQQIVNIRASLNDGLTDSLKNAFPDTVPVPRPIVELNETPDPHWVAGFVDGEGCFYVLITKSENSNSGWRVQLKFQVLSIVVIWS